MKNLQTLFSIFILSLSYQSNATTIFNTTAGIENLEWLELTATEYMSRLDVEAQLGVGGALEGWRYASRTEVETLQDSLWGGTTEGSSADNYAGARIFFDAFGVGTRFLDEDNSGYRVSGRNIWDIFFGNPGDCSVDLTLTCYGHVSIKDMDFGALDNSGRFEEDWGLSTGLGETNTQKTQSVTNLQTNRGSHLVRNVSAVPLPAAFWLFGSGLIGLFGVARKKVI